MISYRLICLLFFSTDYRIPRVEIYFSPNFSLLTVHLISPSVDFLDCKTKERQAGEIRLHLHNCNTRSHNNPKLRTINRCYFRSLIEMLRNVCNQSNKMKFSEAWNINASSNADHEEVSLSIRLLTLPEQRANRVSNAAR